MATFGKFAALRVEDDDDVQEGGFQKVVSKKGKNVPERKGNVKLTAPNSATAQGSAAVPAKKKRRRKPKKQTGAGDANPEEPGTAKDEEDDDEEDVDDEKELEQAILRSKIEYEQALIQRAQAKEAAKAKQIDSQTPPSASAIQNGLSPGRKKSPSGTFTAEEIKQLISDQESGTWERAGGGGGAKKSSPDPDINRLLKDAEYEARRIAMAELKEKEYKKLKPLETAIVALYRTKLDAASKTLDELTAENTQLKEDKDKTKERVRNLCKILQQAEMKDKAELAQDCEKAFKVRDECLHEIEELHVELEQSRTKIRELENEIKRLHDKAGHK